jgi:hypothetical protein
MSESSLSPEQPALPQLYCGNCGAPIPANKHFCEACLAPASLAVTTPPVPQPAPPEPAPAAAVPEPKPPAAPAAVPLAEPLPRPAPLPRPSRPAAPAAWPAAAAVRWPWLLLLVTAAVLSVPLLMCGFVILIAAGDMATTGELSAEEYRLFGLLFCLLPGLIMGGLAILAGTRGLPQRK